MTDSLNPANLQNQKSRPWTLGNISATQKKDLQSFIFQVSGLTVVADSVPTYPNWS